MKKIVIAAVIVILITLVFSNQGLIKSPSLETQAANEQSDSFEIDFFYSETCVHCIAETKFLETIKLKYPQIRINYYPIDDATYHPLLKELVKKHDAEKYLGIIPLTFIKEDLFVGFDSPEKIGKDIEESIEKQLKGEGSTTDKDKNKIRLPIIGKIDIGKYSLPVLAIILGLLDGFNVCSLGALVLILGLILALKSRKQILILGGTFIVTTAIIYGFLIVLWHQLFSLLAPYQRLMTILIGLLGLGGGLYFIKEFIRLRKQGLVCETSNKGIVARLSLKIQNLFKEKKSKSIFAILSMVLLFAAVITIVEFPCSAAVPVAFAGILAKAELVGATHFLYIALFILFYMLDEILVFLIALFTLKLWLTSPKFVIWITLIEAIILFLFAFYYLIGF